MRTDVVNDEDIKRNVLFPGESILWGEECAVPREIKIGVMSMGLFTLFFFIISVIYGSIRGFDQFLFLLITPIFLFVGIALKIYLTTNNSKYYYLVTNFRVAICHIKRNHFANTRSLPFELIESVNLISDHVVQFKARMFFIPSRDVTNDPTTLTSFDALEEADWSENGQEKGTIRRNRRPTLSGSDDSLSNGNQNSRWDSMLFEGVGNANEVEEVVQSQLRNLHSFATTNSNNNIRSRNSLPITDEEDRSSTLSTPSVSWETLRLSIPSRFSELLYLVMEPQIRDNGILWYSNPGYWKLWKPIIITLLISQIVVIGVSFSGVPIFALIGTLSNLSLLIIMIVVTSRIRQSYVLTNKDIFIIRSGYPSPKSPISPCQVHIGKSSIDHCIKIPYSRSFPLVTILDIPSNSGEISFPSQESPHISIIANNNNFKLVSKLIYYGFQQSMRQQQQQQ